VSPAAAKSQPDNPSEICTVRIELLDTDPLIWRQVEVPISMTFKGLHEVVQAAMGWCDMHLWEFRVGKRRYGLPMDEDWGTEPREEAAKVRLGTVLKAGKTTMGYIYDFGDNWEHRLTVTDVRRGASDTRYPRYVAGEWNAPPEDCGGTFGFYDKLEIIGDPEHPDYDEIKEWMGDYDPKVVDEAGIRMALGRIAARRSRAR
jgi:hypothetical protein